VQVALTAALGALAGPTSALERHYIRNNDVFCDVTKTLCLRGTITYEPTYRLLSLNARVQKQTGPGELRLGFSGSNRQGMLRHTEIVMKIKGGSSEILDHRIRPDAPDVDNWTLTSFLFQKDK